MTISLWLLLTAAYLVFGFLMLYTIRYYFKVNGPRTKYDLHVEFFEVMYICWPFYLYVVAGWYAVSFAFYIMAPLYKRLTSVLDRILDAIFKKFKKEEPACSRLCED